MSELKVNTISGIAGSVRVNDPVGIGAVAKSGYDLNVDGKVNLEGSVEVITVPASNFGVRIRAPQTATTSPGFGDATLQFTNYAGTTEWASMHAKTDSSLQIITNNAAALNISSAQVIDHIGQSLFTNKATFNNATQFNGQAIFERSVIPQCGGTPTVSTHLANKAYVDGSAPPSSGVGQTWQTFARNAAGRVANTNYTNSTGKPIMVFITSSDTGGNATSGFAINDVVMSSAGYDDGPNYGGAFVSFIVPNGSRYKHVANTQATYWAELR